MKPTPRRLVPVIGLAVVVAGGAWSFAARPTTGVDSFAACREAGYIVTDTNPPACSDGRYTYLGPRSGPEATAAAAASVTFQLLVDGDSGGKYPRAQEMISSQAEWEAYWRKVHAGLPSLPPLLPVDFKQSSVIALSEGQQPTGGYGFKVTGISQARTGTTVAVTEMVPGPKCIVTQAVSNRYFIVRTDAKLTEPVSYRISVVKRQC